MRALIDTHAFLWLTGASDRLSHPARESLRDGGNVLLLSTASGWELAIKVSLGKLRVDVPREELLTAGVSRAAVDWLPVRPPHMVALAGLPFHHRDPFDRMIAAQCLVDELPLVSADPAFDAYGVRRTW